MDHTSSGVRVGVSFPYEPKENEIGSRSIDVVGKSHVRCNVGHICRRLLEGHAKEFFALSFR